MRCSVEANTRSALKRLLLAGVAAGVLAGAAAAHTLAPGEVTAIGPTTEAAPAALPLATAPEAPAAPETTPDAAAERALSALPLPEMPEAPALPPAATAAERALSALPLPDMPEAPALPPAATAAERALSALPLPDMPEAPALPPAATAAERALSALPLPDMPQAPALPAAPATTAGLQPEATPAAAAAEAPRVDAPATTPAAAERSPFARALVAAIGPVVAEPATPAQRRAAALAAFYDKRDHQPLWTGPAGGFTPLARAAAARIAAAGDDALDPAAYRLPTAPGAADEARAEAEIAFWTAVIGYAEDAQAGRLVPRRVSALMTHAPERPQPEAVIDRIAGATDVAQALESFNPPHPGFQALRRKLVEMRRGIAPAATAPDHPRIPEGAVLRQGQRDPRVPDLRRRLGLPPGDDLYDSAVAEAVRKFQRDNGVPATAALGPRTVDALNGDLPVAGPDVATIEANMERWRWLPRDLGATHIFVNVPEFMVRVKRDGATVHETRVIVGKPETPTPIFSDAMDHVVVNPSWYVPPSILRDRFLPRLASDPGYAERNGFQVIRGAGGAVTIRQPPSERNALGRIKFMFPNEHHVYLHDTPNRSLFSASRRAFSHGCVRVDDPITFGEVIFNLGRPGEGWTENRITGMFGPSERFVRFQQTIPVHLAYFTLAVDAAGQLRRFDDLYGYDRRVIAMLPQATQTRLAGGPAEAVRAAAANPAVPRPARPRPAPRPTVAAAPAAAQPVATSGRGPTATDATPASRPWFPFFLFGTGR